MDLIVGQSKVRDAQIPGKMKVFINKTNSAHHSLQVYLRGKNSNIDGIGAKITLYTDQRNYHKWVQYNYGALPSQNEPVTHFGLGSARVSKIKVRWPYQKADHILEKTYHLKEEKFKTNLKVTLCEDGRVYYGKSDCY